LTDAPRRVQTLGHALRTDTPTMWRLAAHGAVLLLSIGVFVVARIQATPAAQAGLIRAGASLEWDTGGTTEAAVLLAEPVLGTAEGGPSSPEDSGEVLTEGTAAGDAPTESTEGILSPGPVAEADPLLLPWEDPQTHTVVAGDTIMGIAAQYGIDGEALLYANPALRDNPNRLNPGDTLTILPINGVLHIVAEGDTLDSVAARYKVGIDDIVAYSPNNLDWGDTLVAGTAMVVPGGQMEVQIPTYYQGLTGNSGAADYGGDAWNPNAATGSVAGSGQFYIAAYGRISQGYRRYHRAVDIANRTGTPIYAIDGGSVEAAGWLAWAGNGVVIDHGNGYKSLYAHMHSLNVSQGQVVQRGQVIGSIGCTKGRGGRCTGPHLHLEVYFQGVRINPCSLGVCP